jgi:signal transduction histidine kinase
LSADPEGSPPDREDLIRELDRLQRREKARNRFLATVSHEFRTPLTAILTYAEALNDGVLGNLADEQRDAVASIQGATRQLLSMVEEILEFSRDDGDRSELQPEPFEAGELVSEVLASHESLLRRKDLAFSVEVAEDTPPLFADRARTTHTLNNLLANAIDFTPAGGSVAIRVEPRGEDRRWIRIVVEDTGIGIPPEDQERIFEKFVRGREPPDRTLGGTGLGLSIATEFVEMHGGEIGVESEPGEGSRFHFTLPTLENRTFVSHHRADGSSSPSGEPEASGDRVPS